MVFIPHCRYDDDNTNSPIDGSPLINDTGDNQTSHEQQPYRLQALAPHECDVYRGN